ncbi:MAG: hypothetical protein HFF87_06470 [Oscillibacter sp.]|jgi:hypothetical protein|nr:hypothetical protein [Oscillibacter sp.]
MYNRYIRNDNGSYSRIPEEEPRPAAGRTAPEGSPQNRPPPSGAPPEKPSREGPPPGPPPGGPPPGGQHPGDAGPSPAGSGWEAPGPPPGGPPPKGPWPGNRPTDGLSGFLRHILDQLHMDHVDTGDMLLLILLFFLFREDADEELLVALGLLLIL